MILTIVLVALLAGAAPIDAAQPTGVDVAAARSRVEARYEVVPLRGGIGLRPKDRSSRVKMIEIGDGGIAVDGAVVSGRELRDKVGADADAIIPLSYFDASQRQAFLDRSAPQPAEPAVPQPATPGVEPRSPNPDVEPAPRERSGISRRRVGERIHIFRGVTVPRDETVNGQVVAVFGSVRIDGQVTDQVVSVMGSVTLGPDADVGGDVIAVGGRINMADGARVKGDVREISFRSPDVSVNWSPWALPFLWYPFDGTARLIGTMFRLFLLGLFGSLVLLLVRQPVERIGDHVRAEPVKMALVGLLAQLLFFPALFLTAVILAISIIGIPLLLLIPFAILTLLLVFLGGFTSVAYVVGGWGAARAGWQDDQPFLRVWLGVAIVLAPLLVARLFGVVGGPFRLGAVLVASAAFLIEYVAWTTGFGAALATAFERWRNRHQQPPADLRPAGQMAEN